MGQRDIQTRVMVWQAAFTLVLVLVTGAYVVLTKSSADAARQQSEISGQQFQLSAKEFELSGRQYEQDTRPFVYFDDVKCTLTADQNLSCAATIRNVGHTPAQYEVTKAEVSAGGLVEDLLSSDASNVNGVIFPNQEGMPTSYILSSKAQDAASAEKRFKLILKVEYTQLGRTNQTSNSYEVHTLFNQKPENPKEYVPATIVYTDAN